MGKTLVLCGKNSSVLDIKTMLKHIQFSQDDKLYLIGGMTDSKNRDSFVSFINEQQNIIYIMDDMDVFCFYYLYCKKMKADKPSEPVYRQKKDMLSKMAAVRKVAPVLEWAESCESNLFRFYQGTYYEKIVYCGGFSYYISNGIRPTKKTESADRREELPDDIVLFEDALKVSEEKPDYRKFYYFRLRQGDVEGVYAFDQKLSSEESVSKDIRYMPVITAAVATGKLLKKGRETMPVVDTGNVINVYTGGTYGKSEDGMKGTLSCIDLFEGGIVSL